MANLSWQAALIITMGSFVVLCGVVAIAAEWLLKVKQDKRRNRRLMRHGKLYSLRDE